MTFPGWKAITTRMWYSARTCTYVFEFSISNLNFFRSIATRETMIAEPLKQRPPIPRVIHGTDGNGGKGDLLDRLLHHGRDDGVVLPPLEARVDDERGRDDPQEDDQPPRHLGQPALGLRPEVRAVDGRARAKLLEELLQPLLFLRGRTRRGLRTAVGCAIRRSLGVGPEVVVLSGQFLAHDPRYVAGVRLVLGRFLAGIFPEVALRPRIHRGYLWRSLSEVD